MKTGRLLEDIKSKIDIVDFISDYIHLKKSGQNWKGLCPFHSEKTPSFTVNQSKQMFYCFGCGAGGDVVSFLLKYDNLTFNESLNVLAKKAGVKLQYNMADRGAQQKEDKIGAALSDSSDYFADMLNKSEVALGYMKNRGISSESCGIFRLGYAPQGWSNLLKYLRNKGYSDSIIKAAGLAVSGEKGTYDFFRNRIIFPIMGVSGKVIAFGGRALDDSTPKYINSPETAVFNKSDTLFGLYTAKEEIRRQNSVIIVEGYTDVIICRQYGFRNVVAPLGTAMTAGHIQKLRSLTNKPVVVFDGDAAGINAARRALLLICQNNYKARVLLLPDKEDPDSYLKKYGGPSFQKLLEEAMTMIAFILSVSGGEKIEAVREALTLMSEIKDQLSTEEMIIELADRTRINEMTLRSELGKVRNKIKPGASIIPRGGLPKKNNEEYLLLSAVIAFPEKADYVISKLDMDAFKDKTVGSLFKKLSSLGDNKKLSDILDSGDEEERDVITKFSVEPGFDTEHVDRNIEDCLRRIKKRKLDEKIRLAEVSGDVNLINSLLIEKKRFIEETVP